MFADLFLILEIAVLDLFRISKFGFRILFNTGGREERIQISDLSPKGALYEICAADFIRR